MLDQRDAGIAHELNFDKIGDMVLLNPQGYIALRGSHALKKLEDELNVLRRNISEIEDQAAEEKRAEGIAQAVGQLLSLGAVVADKTAATIAFGVPDRDAPVVFGVLAEHGGPQTRARLAGPDGLAHKKKKRARAALVALEAHPGPEVVAPLMRYALAKGRKNEQAVRAIRAAERGAPESPEIDRALVAAAREGNTSQRKIAAGALGWRTTDVATECLINLLTSDKATSVRAMAAGLLAARAGDRVADALRESASSDRAESVRQAAAQALERRERP